MEEIFLRIFGNYTTVDLLSYAWFIFIGYAINALIETTGRDVKSNNTPRKWSWKFWTNDNWRRYIVTILSTYVLFRFNSEFNGDAITDFDAFVMGVLGDGIAATAKKRINALKPNRDKLKKEIEEDII